MIIHQLDQTIAEGGSQLNGEIICDAALVWNSSQEPIV